MSGYQDLGIGGLAFLSTNDLSGLVSDVTNGNTLGTTFKNGVGMCVTMDTANAASVILQTTSKAPIVGILLNNPKAGEGAQIQSVRGSSAKVLAGAAISKGDYLMTDTSGRLITATSGAVSVVAQASEAASAAGNLIQAVILDGYIA